MEFLLWAPAAGKRLGIGLDVERAFCSDALKPLHVIISDVMITNEIVLINNLAFQNEKEQ